LAGLILNRLKNNLKICAVKAPSFGDNRKSIMQDIAIFTGGRFISEEAGVTLENTTSSPEEVKLTLGVAKNITITKDDTIILNGNGSKYICLYAGLKFRPELISSRSRLTILRAAMTRKNSKRGWLN
jgi:chaperonin GroEL (HSP60 family)